MSDEFIAFLDNQKDAGNLAVSPVSFWEIAFLVKKGRIELENVDAWRIRVMENSGLREFNPTAHEMIESVHLPDYHKDPFDRLLIALSLKNNAVLVTKDENITKYTLETLWM